MTQKEFRDRHQALLYKHGVIEPGEKYDAYVAALNEIASVCEFAWGEHGLRKYSDIPEHAYEPILAITALIYG